MRSWTWVRFSSIKHNNMSIDARVDVTPEVTQEATPTRLTTSQIKKHIKEDGMSRDQIRKKYGLTIAEAKAIFSMPSLKGIRVNRKKIARFEIVDDLSDNQVTLEQNIAEVTNSHSDNQSEIQD